MLAIGAKTPIVLYCQLWAIPIAAPQLENFGRDCRNVPEADGLPMAIVQLWVWGSKGPNSLMAVTSSMSCSTTRMLVTMGAACCYENLTSETFGDFRSCEKTPA